MLVFVSLRRRLHSQAPSENSLIVGMPAVLRNVIITYRYLSLLSEASCCRREPPVIVNY